MAASTWNDKFELPNVSFFVPNIQDYFEYIIKYEKLIYNAPIVIYINEIENRITIKVSTGCYYQTSHA